MQINCYLQAFIGYVHMARNTAHFGKSARTEKKKKKKKKKNTTYIQSEWISFFKIS